MGMTVHMKNLQSAIKDLLREYGDEVYKATEKGLDAAAKTLVSELKSETPKGATKKLGKSWKTKKYKLARYVYNTKMVEGKSGEIPLINIVEYSSTKVKPFVKNTFNSSIDKMAQAVVDKIKRI